MKLDHVVIAFHDLSQAIQAWRADGYTVVPGGRHPGRTSHNALVVFEDGAYIELIAWAEPGPAERWYNMLMQHGEGLMDFALLPESVPRAIEEAKARGLALNGPIEGGRVRPDGRKLEWQTARQSTFDLPFLCGDITPREWRVPTGDARRHANGAKGIAKVTVAVANRAVSLRRYEALLGTLDLDAAGGIRIGAATIELVQASRPRGEGPDAIGIRFQPQGQSAT